VNVLSFKASGPFAAFRDPSVTSNQIVYYIPSKSSVIGMLGAMIGIERDNKLGDMYGRGYLDLLTETKIGIKVLNHSKKITLFTNHRSLKEPKTKPFKTEILENPSYEFFVATNESYSERLKRSIERKQFIYSPYFGHAYCPATISGLDIMELQEADPKGKETDCVILDESETYRDNFAFRLEQVDDNKSTVVIERHLHHFVVESRLERRVLKHWIPIGSRYEIKDMLKTELSTFVRQDDSVICMY
jgi:CRISPR-associated protein Cas5h